MDRVALGHSRRYRSYPDLKTIDTLLDDINLLFEKGLEIDDIAASLFGNNIAQNLKERFLEYKNPRERKLSLSQIGKPFRQLWFDIKGTPGEPLTATAKMKFLYGDILEDILIFLCQESGHKVENLQKRVELDGVSGKIDALVDDVLVDFKSSSSRGFTKFEDGSIRNNDPFGYLWQLGGYSMALGGCDSALFAIDKQFGHLALVRFSGKELKETHDARLRIQEIREVLDRPEPPDQKCYEAKPEGVSGNLVLDTGCSYCSHKFGCWGDSNDGKGLRTFLYSTGPKWFTKVKKLPKVFEVAN